MPTNPLPTTYQCPACGWKKTVVPRNQMLTQEQTFEACPECGSHELASQHVTGMVGMLLSQWAQQRR